MVQIWSTQKRGQDSTIIQIKREPTGLKLGKEPGRDFKLVGSCRLHSQLGKIRPAASLRKLF